MFAYVPADAPNGTGHAVVTDRFACLLGGESDAGVAVELYRLLDLPATTLGDVLDVFALHGGDRRFAIVEVLDAAERAVRVAVAGDVAVDLEGASTTRFSGPEGITTFNGESRGVHTLRLTVGERVDTETLLPIRQGVVRTGDITLDPAALPETSPAVAEYDDLATRPLESVKPEPVVVEASSSPAAPVRVDLGAPTAPATLVLQLPDGTELAPDTPVIVGRRPWRTSPEDTTTAYVLAPSPLRQISGTHLEVALVEGELLARDLDSTNGTLVLTPAQAPRLLHEGRSTALHAGDILDLGEDFRISVGAR